MRWRSRATPSSVMASVRASDINWITYMTVSEARLLPLTRESSETDVLATVKEWVEVNVPKAWRDAAPGGRSAIRKVRPIADYEAWYPTFADSGLAVATWPRE